MEHFLEELLQELLDWLIKIASILFQIEGSSDLKLFYQWNIFPWYFLSEFHLKIINSCSIQAAKLVSSPQRPKWGGLVVMSTKGNGDSGYWALKLNSKIDLLQVVAGIKQKKFTIYFSLKWVSWQVCCDQLTPVLAHCAVCGWVEIILRRLTNYLVMSQSTPQWETRWIKLNLLILDIVVGARSSL